MLSLTVDHADAHRSRHTRRVATICVCMPIRWSWLWPWIV